MQTEAMGLERSNLVEMTKQHNILGIVKMDPETLCVHISDPGSNLCRNDTV